VSLEVGSLKKRLFPPSIVFNIDIKHQFPQNRKHSS
jgi:hypothetical protein